MLKKNFYLLLIFILCGCMKNESVNETALSISKNNEESVVANETLNLAMSPIKTFNPLKNKNEGADKIFKLVFEPLIKFDESGQIVNNLAEQIIFDENYTAHIKLRDDIFWSDKSNLTADDVIFSIDQIKSADENSIYKLSGENIISYKKTSVHNLDIKFKDGAYVSIYLLNFPVIPEKSFATENKNVSSIISNGPYKFSSYTKMKSVQLKKNEKYFADAPSFKNINAIIISDHETITDAFNQNVIDLVSTDTNDIEKFRSDAQKIFYPTDELEFIFFNPTNNLFNIQLLYNALVNILPLEKIRSDVYSGILDNSLIATKFEKVDSAQIISEYMKPTPSLKILVNVENVKRIKTAALIKKTFALYGINSVIEKKKFDEYKTLPSKNFDIFIGGFKPQKSFDYEKLLGINNIFAYKNEDIVKNLEQIKLAIKNTEFNLAIKNLSSAVSNNSKIIILGRKKKILLVNKNFHLKEPSLICKFFGR